MTHVDWAVFGWLAFGVIATAGLVIWQYLKDPSC
jgi:hypothetical protein